MMRVPKVVTPLPQALEDPLAPTGFPPLSLRIGVHGPAILVLGGRAMRFSWVSGFLAALLAIPLPTHAADVAVDLELVLAVDVSRSMDASEQKVQRDGYINAIRHP